MSFNDLVSRKIFHNNNNNNNSSSSSSSSFSSHFHTNRTCPVPNESGPAIVAVVGDLTFQQLAEIIAGAMTGLACLLSLFLIMKHATHFSVPSEQKHIIRIIFTVPVFAIISLLSIVAESKAIYLTPVLDVYEATALASFFLLLCNYIDRSAGEREMRLDESGKLGMYHRVWFFVFQQPVVMFIVFIATEITQAANVYCDTSRKVQFAHIWLSSIELMTSMVAILAVVRFYSGTKSMTAEHKPLLKLISFKIIIFLWTVQDAIFHYLSSSGDIHANKHLSFLDFTVGIQSLIVCAEMVFVSIFFQFAYPVSPYVLKHQSATPSGSGESHAHYFGGFLGIKAILAAANIFDILKGIIVAPANLIRGRAMGKRDAESGDQVPLERKWPATPKYDYAEGK